jgi:hypothetical protein
MFVHRGCSVRAIYTHVLRPLLLRTAISRHWGQEVTLADLEGAVIEARFLRQQIVSPDHDKAEVLPAGSFFALSPGSDEFSSTALDHGVISYVNTKDDPRKCQ